MTERSVRRAADLLARRVGWHVERGVRARLARCVHEGADAAGCSTDDYVERLSRDPRALQEFLDRVTIQESAFFRDPAQFEAFATHVVPQVSERVSVWSAGCANGQEAYSLAMTLTEAGVREWEVTATDVSKAAVVRTAAGRYSESEVQGLSAARRQQFMVHATGEWRVRDELRSRVHVALHNLVTDAPPLASGGCHVVFCRNVLIYLRRPDVETFLQRLARWLPPEAYLFLGYSESLWHITDLFRLERLGDAFVYRPAVFTRTRAQPGARDRARPTAARAQARPSRKAVGDLVALLAEGEAAFSAGDHTRATSAFQRAAILEPQHPIAHLHLGLVLQATGDARGAHRAFAAARAALDAYDTAAVEAALEGYHVDELANLLDEKLERDSTR